ncbi:LacI family DNA-binding transcriptional regulator [Exiguobacterium aurantiacum]|uniref:LacI family DNA-binding transcriptional regulator n=1 Tax=Exiguobacterium aurantiacum TaxID=33987 RepID=UPI000513EB71|nr:LacI family DNA-binding transcriptional regulator [Exiguobacterium aurantiacum]KGI85448.1 DNA-binding protein [Exiguobacterium mexicanum]
MATINEIASKAGVSRTTVSRVLNDSGYVSEAARLRVLKVIEETGYVPSESAKSLRTKKSKVVGVVLPKISTETSSRLVKGIDDVLAAKGYQILLVNTNLSIEKETESLRLLKSRNVDGIILSATHVSNELQNVLKETNVPNVVVGQPYPEMYNVVFDDFSAAKELTKKLIENGHKKIAYLGVADTDYSVGVMRRGGVRSALEEANIQLPLEWDWSGTFDIQSGQDGMKAIIEAGLGHPDVVIAATDRLAVGAFEYLKQKRIEVPKEVLLAGMGTSELSRYVIPSLLTIDFPIEEAGKSAAELLLTQIEGKKTISTKVISHRLIE